MDIASISQVIPIIQDMKENQLLQLEYHTQRILDKLQVSSVDISSLIEESNHLFDTFKNAWSELLNKIQSKDSLESYQTTKSQNTIQNIVTYMYQDEISTIQLPSYLIEEFPDSLFYQYYKDPDCYDSEGYIYIDHPSTFLPQLLMYMKSKRLDIQELSESDKYILYEQFVFYNIPIPIELLPYDPSILIHQLWNQNHIRIVVNSIPYTIYKHLLIARNIEDSIFQQDYQPHFSFDIYTKSFIYQSQETHYFYYIEQYISKGVFLLNNKDQNYEIIKQIIIEASYFNIQIDLKLFIRYAPIESEDRYLNSILLNDKGRVALTNWCGKEKQWIVAFRASEHEYSAKSFHEICNHKGETIIVIKTRSLDQQIIFGGYTFASWTDENRSYYDPFAFIFTIENPFRLPPHQFKIQDVQNAIRCIPTAGPVFGDYDIYISDRCNRNRNSFIGCDGHHSYKNSSNKKMAIFTNSGDINQINNFVVEDYEVFIRT